LKNKCESIICEKGASLLLALVVTLADGEVQALLVTVADATADLTLHGGVVQLTAAAAVAGHVPVVVALEADAHVICFLLVEVF
jgi:hypothetical protein